MPVGAASFSEALRWGTETYHALKSRAGRPGAVHRGRRRGRLRADLPQNEDAVKLLVEAIELAGRTPGDDIALALDPATSELWNDGRLRPGGGGADAVAPPSSSTTGWTWSTATRSCRSRTAWPRRTGTGWSAHTKALGGRIQLVGDDIFVTNAEILERGIREGVANADPGQAQPDRDADRDARHRGAGQPVRRTVAVISHRSGETEDTTIADLAVAVNAGQIKAGAPARSDRVAKYNQLLRIEEDLGESAAFPGRAALGGRRGRAWRRLRRRGPGRTAPVDAPGKDSTAGRSRLLVRRRRCCSRRSCSSPGSRPPRCSTSAATSPARRASCRLCTSRTLRWRRKRRTSATPERSGASPASSTSSSTRASGPTRCSRRRVRLRRARPMRETPDRPARPPRRPRRSSLRGASRRRPRRPATPDIPPRPPDFFVGVAGAHAALARILALTPRQVDDNEAVAALLGRDPGGNFVVVVRNPDGAPMVIENEPFLRRRDAHADPLLARRPRAAGPRQPAGGVRRSPRSGASVDAAAVAECHRRYAAERDALIPPEWSGPRPGGGVGGTRRRRQVPARASGVVAGRWRRPGRRVGCAATAAHTTRGVSAGRSCGSPRG